jgi:ferredoxin-NADP reductase
MNSESIQVSVIGKSLVAPAIMEFTFQPVHGELKAFSPGAHIVVEMKGVKKTYKNAYSLLSDGRDTAAYRIAVRLQEASRGGSLFMHEQVQLGDRLSISPPANLFAPVWQAKKHVLIAGGVGITPFLSYIPEFERRNADFELHYLFRGSQTGAYKAQLKDRLGSNYHEYDSDRGGSCDIASLFNERCIGTHFYICGPESLIKSVLAAADDFGLPRQAIHYEEFAAPEPGIPFVIEQKATGKVINVDAEQTALEALEAAGIAVPNLCRAGVCGQCVCDVKSGEVEHRDSFLSAQERADGKAFMPCVSRAKGQRLVVDC